MKHLILTLSILIAFQAHAESPKSLIESDITSAFLANDMNEKVVVLYSTESREGNEFAHAVYKNGYCSWESKKGRTGYYDNIVWTKCFSWLGQEILSYGGYH